MRDAVSAADTSLHIAAKPACLSVLCSCSHGWSVHLPALAPWQKGQMLVLQASTPCRPTFGPTSILLLQPCRAHQVPRCWTPVQKEATHRQGHAWYHDSSTAAASTCAARHCPLLWHHNSTCWTAVGTIITGKATQSLLHPTGKRPSECTQLQHMQPLDQGHLLPECMRLTHEMSLAWLLAEACHASRQQTSQACRNLLAAE